jgi:tRNA threonylcarbamoyladenosine biosynthesis protein TsaB
MTSQELILAIETSSRMGSVAIGDRKGLKAESMFSGPMRHSAEIMPTIQRLLGQLQARPEDVRQVCLSIGPGSFTGLRIAVTMAKALALANKVQIVSVDTLDVIASNVPPTCDAARIIAPILDAKRDQFFVAVYERQGPSQAGRPAQGRPDPMRTPAAWVKVQADSIMTSAQFVDRFADPSRPIAVLGDGLVYHRERFEVQGVSILDEAWWSPTAAAVYHLGLPKVLAGQFEDPLRLVPTYLLPPEVTLKKEVRSKR